MSSFHYSPHSTLTATSYSADVSQPEPILPSVSVSDSALGPDYIPIVAYVHRSELERAIIDPTKESTPGMTIYNAKKDSASRRAVRIACTHCHNSAKRCDVKRPCTRCIDKGLQDSCVNEERKTRGGRSAARRATRALKTRMPVVSDGRPASDVISADSHAPALENANPSNVRAAPVVTTARAAWENEWEDNVPNAGTSLAVSVPPATPYTEQLNGDALGHDAGTYPYVPSDFSYYGTHDGANYNPADWQGRESGALADNQGSQYSSGPPRHLQRFSPY